MISNTSASDLMADAESLPCYMVNNLTTNSAEQCKFIIDNDCLEDESFIDYMYLVYCELGYELRHASIFVIAFILIILFLNLSSVADEFLCPSLLSVAKNLRMSDSLAGVTLLAFGNGCPDIFSSIAAASSGRPELIVGELLGAGIFCTSIVAGLIFIHSDFKLATRPLLRDAIFYLLAAYLMWWFCWDERITFYGSLSFIIIYVIYLVVALSGQAAHARLQGNYAVAENNNTNHLGLDETSVLTGNWFRRCDESIRRKRTSLANNDKLSLIDKKIEGSQVKVSYTNGPTSTHLDQKTPEGCEPTLECQIYTTVKTISGGCENAAFVGKDEVGLEMQKPSGDPSADKRAELFANQAVMKLAATKADDSTLLITLSEWDNFLSHLSPIDSENWQESNFLGKCLQVVRCPLLFLAIVTVPVVDMDKKSDNWCRMLNCLHCVTMPLFVTIVGRFDDNWNPFGVPSKFILLIPCSVLATAVFLATSDKRAPKYHAIFAYFGFAISILWIYLLATEIISLLKTIGMIFSMTDTAIGLGVLAWGNSLGDIVANLSLADAGYPRMALGASIGAPLLNLLLGYGLAFTLSLKPGQFSPLEYSPTTTLLCSTLALILISLMLSTLVPPHRSRKPFGYALICVYGVYFAVAVLLESGIIKRNN